MRRFAAAVLLILWLPALSCAAAEGCYAEYVPRSGRSAVFSVDIYSEREITAAVFELRFDEHIASFYAVSAEKSSASVRENVQTGKVTVAFADSAPVKGKLCRVSFKALKQGTADFVLHMVQAADAQKNPVSSWNDFTLTVSLGDDDVVSSGSAAAHSSKTVSASSKSSLRGKSRSDDADDGEADDADGGDAADHRTYDLRRNGSPVKWLLIGAGIPVLCGALVLSGVLIGRKSKDKSDKTKKPGEELPEPDIPDIDDITTEEED